ncbi:Aminopeptidase E [Oenococcus oeni]|uniref:C1 family peptidase n=1 Tax=Oenococcus oeni TaxID=1247 RepID=UPI00107C0739|nr:C1 family peptidase [Oenococcus oeni]AVI93368.1 aminopeptidase [Oenococcus oeni]SYV98488.1 Aminopeptidase E [Oenococcus oeni]SYW04015.1 Aminopeptidase E [Oenococcus oeni]SYW18949.1 Aminopeptidase E [Oenococcus oeni]VDC13749.1 Aminopeptidase E [Oenococcus oeni]
MASALTKEKISSLRDQFKQNKEASIITRTVTKNGIHAASYDNTAATRLNRTFSIELDTGKVTNQKHSGRCWEFSMLNTLRHTFAKKYHVKDFQLSQNYLFFWDKIERANIFYQNIERTAQKPINDREVEFFLDTPGQDGGQWAMAAGLIEKYGLMPASAMPESYNTNKTDEFAEVMDKKLRKDALAIRKLVANGATKEKIEASENEMLAEVYRIAAYSFGEPPKKFDLEYRDDNKKYHREAKLTAKKFYKEYFNKNFDNYVVVTNSPDKPLNKLYSLPCENNIIKGRTIEFLNVDMKLLADLSIQQLKDGETVWFGNDVLQQLDRQAGFLDSNLYRTEELFSINTKMTKAERLLTGEGQVSHAMTLTGVDLIDKQPTKWKVENSWGDKIGKDGYFVMSQDWFENFVYEVVVHKKYLSKELQEILKQPAEELPVWDPLH